MKKFLLSGALFLSIFVLSAQEVLPQFEKNGETYFKIEIPSVKILPDLTKVISIDNVQGNTVNAYANEKEFKRFLEMGLPYKLLPHPNEGFNPTMATFEQIQNSDNWNYYPTYDAYVALMYQFETDYPNLCDVFSIGQLASGRELLVAKISDNVNTDENEPEFLYTSSMHGDELTGFPLMLNLIDSLLANYGAVSRITNMVNEIEIYINPLANPDGTYAGGNNTVSGATRYNSYGVDLNRNFPDVVSGLHPNTQTETLFFMEFAEDRNFVMSANFHGGAEVCNYPWDHKYDFVADDDWWQFVCHEYADTCQAYSPSAYMNGFNDGITNGADWYPIDGGRQDYMNYFHQCREVTLEISNIKLISATLLEAHWEYNRRSLLNYMEQCLYGIRGVITDENSGLPLEAEVYILNHEADSSWVYSEIPTGNYHRLVNEGTYNVRFSAPCYEDRIINNVAVNNYSATILNIQLVRSIADFTANSAMVTPGQDVQFTDISCQTASTSLWAFSGPGNAIFVNGTNAGSQNPVVQFNSNGNYTVSLEITGSFGTDTKTETDYIYVSDCSYCPSTYSNTTDDWISHVTFNTINNTSGQGGLDSYEDFTSVSTEVVPGNPYPISITFEMNGDWNQACFAFFDWNQDCDFGDANESYNLGYQQNSGTLNSSINIPTDVLPGTIRMRIVEQYIQYPGPCDDHPTLYGETEDYKVIVKSNRVNLDLTVFLEGPFNLTGMNTGLTGLTNFPLNQPYNISPWNYSGIESVSSVPAGVVDWLLLELHDATDASFVSSGTLVDTPAAFLLSDGSVVGMDGTSMPEFEYSPINDLFILIRHRNHLDILSANALTKVGENFSYDFSTGPDKIYGGTDGCKELTTGIWGMIGGDANADGTVDSLDKSDRWDFETGLPGYLSSDLDMNGESNNQDKNELWIINKGDSSQLPY